MKTIRTIFATFGVTTLLYGVFALIAAGNNFSFTGRSIFQLFRETGFVTLVIGIGFVLSAVIMTIAIVSFRDEGSRRKHETSDIEDELDEFLEEETVPEERAAEADETWSSEIKRKQRRALRHTEEIDDEEPYEYYAEEDELQSPVIPVRSSRSEEQPEPASIPIRSTFRSEPQEPAPKPVIRSSFRSNPEPQPSRPAAEPEYRPEDDRKNDAQTHAPEPLASKYCPHCGESIDGDSAFCIYCGKRV